MSLAYYNEIDPYAAAWLRNLIAAGHLPPGEVDERDIRDVASDDLRQFRQCHFFAGIGGWALAARLAGWPDDRELWTGSAPCQPFSVAGKGKAQADDRHLWPDLFRLIRSCRPAVFMGEQVAAAVGKDWFDGVRADLDSIGYACGGVVVPACAVDAPHRRDRLWFVADAELQHRPHSLSSARDHGDSNRRQQDTSASSGHCRSGAMADAYCERGQVHSHSGWREERSAAREISGSSGACDGAMADTYESGASEEQTERGREQCRSGVHPWARHSLLVGADGKARRVEPGIRLLAHGVPARVGKLRAYGNAIVPQVAAEVIGAYMDTAP